MKEKRIDIQICTRDRPTELYGLLQSLRTQTIQKFDIYILDDGGKTSTSSYYFIQYIINRMQLEGHNVKLLRNEIPSGVSKARQILVDYSLKNTKSKLYCRIDDDTLLEPDYLEKLLFVINDGYDIASGVTTSISQPDWKRDIKYISPIIGYCELDKEGNIIFNGDDCGIDYIDNVILLSPHFRSCAMFKREVFEGGVDYSSRLSKNGFREEQIISFKAICKGFKIGVHTGANALHLMTPSGGERDTMNMTGFNEQIFRETTKKLFEEHGDFLDKYYKKYLGKNYKKPAKMEYLKSTNLNGLKPEIKEGDVI